MVTLTDIGLEHLVLTREALQVVQCFGFRAWPFEIQLTAQTNGGGHRAVDERGDALFAQRRQHARHIGIGRPIVAGDEIVVSGQLGQGKRLVSHARNPVLQRGLQRAVRGRNITVPARKRRAGRRESWGHRHHCRACCSCFTPRATCKGGRVRGVVPSKRGGAVTRVAVRECGYMRARKGAETSCPERLRHGQEVDGDQASLSTS